MPAARKSARPTIVAAASTSTNGIVEQPEAELVGQQPPYRFVEPALGDLAGLHEADQPVAAVLAAELVDAGIEQLQDPLVGAQVLDTPRPGRAERADAGVVGHQVPVGAHDTVEAQLLAQQTGDHRSVEAEPDLLVLGADRHAVVRHDLRRPGFDRGPERTEVVLEPSTGVHLFTPPREVRVVAVLLRPSAREVLGHRRHRLGPERFALEPTDVRDGEHGREFGIFAEGLADPRPARFGGEVDLWVQGHPDPDRQVLLPGDVAELAHQFGRTDRTETQRLGPLGERAGQDRQHRVVGEVVTRVGRQRHGDGQRLFGGDLLQRVVPLRELAPVVEGTHQAEMGEPPLGHHLPCRRARQQRVHRVEVARGHHRVEHQPGLVLERQSGQQVADALLDRQLTVLVRVRAHGAPVVNRRCRARRRSGHGSNAPGPGSSIRLRSW